MNIFAHILVIFMMTIFFLIILKKQSENIKLSNDLGNILIKNCIFFINMYRKKIIVELKNTIQIYSKFQIIQKISNADYISFFRYDYTKNCIELDFLFSIDNNGTVIQNSVLDKFSIVDESIKDILISKCELCSLKVNETENFKVYDILREKKLNKIYYHNIFKKDIPVVFFAILYKNGNYILDETDKIEILRIIDTMTIEDNFLNINDLNDLIHLSSAPNKDQKNIIPTKKYKKWLHKFFITMMLLSISTMLFFNYFYVTSDKVSNYFKPYEISNTRGIPTENNIGIYQYKQGEFADALKNFEICLKYQKNETILFYAGCSAFFANDTDKALNYFNGIEKDSPYIENAEWYEAGCYLKKKDIEKSKSILTKIANDPENFYSEEALKILQTNLLKD